MRLGPNGITNPDEHCEVCGEWQGSREALIHSSRRHAACFKALVAIQEIVSNDNPDIASILDITIKTIGDKR
jgi:5,10-methenyltetrahydromethanopterin hydrogenase